MKFLPVLGLPLLTFFTAFGVAAPADDYKALTAGLQSLRMGGTSGGVALQGRLTIPLAMATDKKIVAAAGHFDDKEAGGRMVCFAHTSFLEGGDSEQRVLGANAAKWAGRKPAPKVLVVGGGARWWKDAGLDAIDGKLTAEALKGVDVAVLNLHRNPFAGGTAALEEFAAKGGGVIMLSTPWALGKEALATANGFLDKAGLAFLGGGSSETSYPVLKDPPSQNWSALNAADALVADKKGTQKLSQEEKQLCAATLDGVLDSGKLTPRLQSALAELSTAYGWIRFTKAPALKKANFPVEATVARFQSHLLDSLPAEKVPAHPSATDFPGAVGDGPAVTTVVKFDATTGPDKLINHGYKTIINTGVYARPGQPVTVTIPENAVSAGLQVVLGVHIDKNWHLKSWHRAPSISRKETLKQPVTKIANAFGGLVFLQVPENCNLGVTQATIAGAVKAPVYTLGKTTAAEWAKAKEAPGAWGYIEAKNWTGYVPREILQKVENPEFVASYWQTVVATADDYMGYAKWRRRGEAMLTDRDIVAGYGHAGYPVMMAYAAEDEGSRALVERGPEKGDWGFLHELGHTFQDSFDGNYTIATHAEVDVNLVPGIVMMLVHDRTAWDNNCHSTFNAKNRMKDMTAWDAQPADQRTWDKACKGSSVAYDFYFTMAECFGWDLYRKALGRMMDHLQKPGNDKDLDDLDKKDPNFKRNRFFLCFSQAAGRNLLPHFERYGLGRGEYGISASVVEKVKALPVWSGNQAITSLTGPSTLKLKAPAVDGKPVAQFTAQDPDAGTRFTYSITGGNDSGAFAIHHRKGALTLAKAPAPGSYSLEVEVSDSTIPATKKTTRCEVVVE